LGSLGAGRRPSAVPAAVARAPAAPERVEDGADAGERGAAPSVPGIGRRLDARPARQVMRRTPGRPSPHQS
jgi:hypothetical protein